MRVLSVFNAISLDGFFVDAHGDMSWAHHDDPEWLKFTSGNAGGDSELLLGRKTYEMMASFWPTPAASAMSPEAAAGMNRLSKIVFSKKLKTAAWPNTRLVSVDAVAEVKRLKRLRTDKPLVILGSGKLVSSLAAANLIDEFQLAVNPLILGKGRTLFPDVRERLSLRLKRSRAFKNGTVLLTYSA